MIQELLKYQEIDAKLKKIENELADSPERKKAVTAKKYLDGVEENVNKLDDKASNLSAEYQAKLEELNKFKELEQELVSALNEIDDQAQAGYLIKKAEELIAKIKSVNAEINNLSNAVSAVMKEYVNIKNTTKAAQLQYNENGKKYNEFKASKQAEKTEIEQQLATLKAKVDPKLMEMYLQKRANKIYPVVYEVSNSVCGACSMSLSLSELNKLKNGEVIECDQCGRILYQK
jgi:predicted  nucleic acid-binding Zn-ribbon protein